jgi:predicted GTPase
VAAGGPLAEVGHDLDPCTPTVKHFLLQHHEYDVVFVDTPGFNNPWKTDGVILEEIINWLKSKSVLSVLSQMLYFVLILHQILPRHAVQRYRLSA